MFSAKDLYVRFDGLVALDNFSLTVAKGEIVAVIGPNGSGKTTFFNTISGFVSPERGQIMFNAVDITNISPHKVAELGIARTFQNLELFPYLTVMENVLVGLHERISKRQALVNLVSRTERQRQELLVLEILDFMGISGFQKAFLRGGSFQIRISP